MDWAIFSESARKWLHFFLSVSPNQIVNIFRAYHRVTMIPIYKPIIALGNVIGCYQIIPKTKDVENLHLIIPGLWMGIFVMLIYWQIWENQLIRMPF